MSLQTIKNAVLVTGQAGAGKTTAGSYLSAEGWEWFDLDDRPDLATLAPEDPGEPYRDAWRPDWGWRTIDIDALRRALASSRRPIVVTGITINQCRAFGLFDRVLWLSMTPATMLARLDARGGLKDLDPGRRERYPRNMLLMERWALEADAMRIDANRDLATVLQEVVTECRFGS